MICVPGDIVSNEDNKERFSKPEREKVPERKTKELDGYVGFANLPNQVYRKAVKKGFDLTLMLVGKIGNFPALRMFWFELLCNFRRM